jgi:hypothetical protein
MPAKVTIGDMNGLFAQVNRRARYAMSPQNGELLMAVSSRNWAEACTLLSNARDIAATTLSTAPSFNEIRKELAIAMRGSRTRPRRNRDRMGRMYGACWRKARLRGREVFAHSVGDHRERDRRDRAEKRLTSLLP